MEISWDHSSVLPFLNRFFRAVSWHWPLTAVPGRGAGSAWGAVTPLPPSREALKPFCRKARGERKQGEKEREEEREREINKQKLAASVLSSRAGSAAGAGARLWFCLTDPLRAVPSTEGRAQNAAKRCPVLKETWAGASRLQSPPETWGCIPPGASSFSCANTSGARACGLPRPRLHSGAAQAGMALHHRLYADLFSGAVKGTKPFTKSSLFQWRMCHRQSPDAITKAGTERPRVSPTQ